MKSRQILAYQKCTLVLTNEQSVLLSTLKMLIAVSNGDFRLPYLSSYEIECLITDIATL